MGAIGYALDCVITGKEPCRERLQELQDRDLVEETLAQSEAYPRLAAFADRMEHGCRCCGVKGKDGVFMKGAISVDSLCRREIFDGSFHATKDKDYHFHLCEDCLEDFLEVLNTDLSPKQADEWYVKENAKVRAELERQKELRRKRDSKPGRKAARRAKKEANDPWIRLAKLDILAEEGSTEPERINARQKASELRGRLIANVS